METPWLMEIANADLMTELYETWLNDVNEDF